ncbi:MAG: PfkB family carbohydrate kinase [Pseudomonadota bacterium]
MGMIAAHPDARFDAIVIGRAGLDLYPDPPGTRTDQAAHFVTDLGGSAGNIAVALARHGLRVGLAAPISDDPVGAYVSAALARFGVDHLTKTPVAGEARTSLALAETISEGSRTVIYRNDAADFQLHSNDLPDDVAASSRTVIATGTALARSPSRETTLAALRNARTAILDLDYRPYSWGAEAQTRAIYADAIEACDVVVGNIEEFAQISGQDGFDAALEMSKSRAVLYKMGSDGARFLRAGEAGPLIAPFRVDALKPFGAGDAFLGGTLARLLTEDSPEEAMRFGAAAAALVVSRVGCASAMPDSAETRAFITAQQG